MSSESPEIDLKALKEELEKATAEITAFDLSMIQMRQKYLEEVDAIKTQKNKLQMDMAEKKRKIKELEKQKAEKEAIDREKNALLELNSRLADLSAELDRLTIGAKWREFAYDHQLYAAKRIAFTHGFVLADEMGLGKTLSSIIAIDMIQAKTKDASFLNPVEPGFPMIGLPSINKPAGLRVLYLCPKSLLSNVKKEFSEWSPNRHVYPLMDSLANKATRDLILNSMLPNQTEFTVIINHEAWRRDKKLLESLTNLNFDTVIIDEAHRLKSVDSDAYATVINLIDRSQIPFRLVMTGTPILNKPDDIWTALHIIAPRYFPRRSDFLYNFCEQKWVRSGSGHRLVWGFRPGGEKALLQRIESLILKRSLTDVGIQLPALTVEEHELVPDTVNYPEQYRAYNEMKQYGAALAADGTTAVQTNVIIAMLTRLRQILHWPAGIVIKDPITLAPIMNFDIKESQKLDYIIRPMKDEEEAGASKIPYEGILPEFARHQFNPDGHRVVMFSQFTSVLTEMQRRLTEAGYKVAMITGSTTNQLRTKYQLDFDRRWLEQSGKKGEFDIILCQYQAGGVGLNLTDATELIVIDSAWNPAMRNQAYARLHRIGQEFPVRIHEISVTQSVDAWMQGIMSVKEALLEGFDTELDLRSAFREALESGDI